MVAVHDKTLREGSREWGIDIPLLSFILHPLPFILYPSAFILQPLSFILYPSAFSLYPLSFILYPLSFILYPSSFILHPSPFILYPSSFILHPSSFSLLFSFFSLLPISSTAWSFDDKAIARLHMNFSIAAQHLDSTVCPFNQITPDRPWFSPV